MTFAQWDRKHYPEPSHHNMILNGIERGQRKAGWEAGQEAMRERAAEEVERLTALGRTVQEIVEWLRELPIR